MGYRLAVASKFINQGYGIGKVLKYCQLARTSWYRCVNKEARVEALGKVGRPIPGYSYNKFGKKIFDSEIIAQIKKLREQEIYLMMSGGYKKLKYYLLADMGVIVNKKKIYRLCKENNLLFTRKRKTKYSRQLSMNRVVSRPHQVWEFDIKYGYIHRENRFFYILVYIDVFSRAIVNYHLGLNCKAKHLAGTFSTALRKAGLDSKHELVIRSDNGPQMTSKMFYKYLLTEVAQKVEHEFIPCSMPNKNAHVESLYSIIENEFIAVHYFKSFKDVYIKFAEFVKFYNTRRVHSSLKYRTPEAVMELAHQGKLPADIVSPGI